jgi:hypothetical protein
MALISRSILAVDARMNSIASGTSRSIMVCTSDAVTGGSAFPFAIAVMYCRKV